MIKYGYLVPISLLIYNYFSDSEFWNFVFIIYKLVVKYVFYKVILET